jgi:hypothetical protein
MDFDKRFTLLKQEAYLTKNTLLSGFDLLIKANFFQEKDGYFYSGFSLISIGMERILKLAVITHYMLENNYRCPTIKQLQKDFGHNIDTLYSECQKLIILYNDSSVVQSQSPKTINDDTLIAFFTKYAIRSRYFNLNELCEAKMEKSPLDNWFDLARAIYQEYTPEKVIEKSAFHLMCKIHTNRFTGYYNTQGYLMTEFDFFYAQYIIEKSSPLVIWRIIEILRPIYFLLSEMAYKATDYAVENNIRSIVIPYYEEFFNFLLMDKASIRKKKNWLKNS